MRSLRALLLLALATLGYAVLPPGATSNNVNSIAPGQYLHCVGNVANTGTPATATVSQPLQGTAALLEYSGGLAYDEYNQALWYGTNWYLYKIDPATCTLEKKLGGAGVGNIDGNATNARFDWITSFAALPNRKVIVTDYNCRLRLYDPASNTVAPLWGPSGNLGALTIDSCNTFLVAGANTVGSAPALTSGRFLFGRAMYIAYDWRENRVFLAGVSATGYSEIWSLDTAGGDPVVVSTYNVAGDNQGGFALDPLEPFLYAVTAANRRISKISTRAPYTSTLISGPLAGVSGYNIVFLSLTAPLVVPYAAMGAYAPIELVDTNGASLGLIKPDAPPDICPGVATGSWGDCWNNGLVATTRSGLIYSVWSRASNGRALYVYRPAVSNLIKVSGGSNIVMDGGSITMTAN